MALRCFDASKDFRRIWKCAASLLSTNSSNNLRINNIYSSSNNSSRCDTNDWLLHNTNKVASSLSDVPVATKCEDRIQSVCGVSLCFTHVCEPFISGIAGRTSKNNYTLTKCPTNTIGVASLSGNKSTDNGVNYCKTGVSYSSSSNQLMVSYHKNDILQFSSRMGVSQHDQTHRLCIDNGDNVEQNLNTRKLNTTIDGATKTCPVCAQNTCLNIQSLHLHSTYDHIHSYSHRLQTTTLHSLNAITTQNINLTNSKNLPTTFSENHPTSSHRYITPPQNLHSTSCNHGYNYSPKNFYTSISRHRLLNTGPQNLHTSSHRHIHTSPVSHDIYMITTEEEFERLVMKSTLPVVVNFHADWCEPCHELRPVLESLADKYKGRMHLAEVKVDDNVKLLHAFEVTAVPAVVGVVGGQVTEKFIGLISEKEVRAFVNTLIEES